MAKKPEPTKPIFPIKHEFVASLDRFIHEAGMLRDTARQLLQLNLIKNDEIVKMLKERVDAFDLARFGEARGE